MSNMSVKQLEQAIKNCEKQIMELDKQIAAVDVQNTELSKTPKETLYKSI